MGRKKRLMQGALLHDLGKILTRSSESENNPQKAVEKFIEKIPLADDIKEIILINDLAEIEGANLRTNSLSYLVALANHIARGIDLKTEEGKRKRDKNNDSLALHSIFNHLLDKKEKVQGRYALGESAVVRYPKEEPIKNSREDYGYLKRNLEDYLHESMASEDLDIADLLQWAEENWQYVPYSVNESKLLDITLYDHSKMSCAIASCLYDVAEELELSYAEVFQHRNMHYYKEDFFLLVSMDMSGIQDFIYSISGENALKSLRTRSFYLEMILEVIVDELLDRLTMSRANLLYTGGGHAYLLLPNTKKAIQVINETHKQLKQWFIKQFKIDISLSIAHLPCSGNDLMNRNGNYRNLWQNLTDQLEQRKSQKYTMDDLLGLNQANHESERECKECLRSDTQLLDDRCILCNQIIQVSNKLRDKDYFIISDSKGDLMMPFGQSLTMADSKEVNNFNRTARYRIYSKNNPLSQINKPITASLWMCDYDYASTKENMRTDGIASYAKLREKGIKRLGVMRADIDDLGMAFINGIPENLLSISRTATLSRRLSMFFKLELTKLLEGSQVTVIYSGGDDIFLIGAWDEVVNKSVEVRKAFEKFTLNSLTFSAGIGIFRKKFPVSKMAEITGELEEESKKGDKNQVTLWKKDQTLSWKLLSKGVLQEKLPLLERIFTSSEDHGMTFLYKMQKYLTDHQKINIARFAYLLSRSKLADDYSRILFSWINNKGDRKELIIALQYYIYKNREV